MYHRTLTTITTKEDAREAERVHIHRGGDVTWKRKGRKVALQVCTLNVVTVRARVDPKQGIKGQFASLKREVRGADPLGAARWAPLPPLIALNASLLLSGEGGTEGV
ncbi:hypothetical protein E2C01_080554 [Portunus trituberculatus]|uniref:Uncharacterized protein n=1 Tax=Portunus trituberculatus TaxID=210409 RepID=A0A5B7IPI6_PORTR|nr:hypothetical protein [Portunus trituberculatus]